ncbi:MAG: ATP synthase subunit I [Desulfobulbaceae bacterium]|nr:MAG: ATP synthase subunit I [Desulfobulbaceae bacterium]
MTDDLISLRKMQVMSWVYLAVLMLGAGIIHSMFFAWSVFVGGVISIISFWVCHNDVIHFIGTLTSTPDDQGEKTRMKRGKAGYLIKFWVRIAIIGVVLLVFIKYQKVNIFGLILGLSTVVFTITFTAVNVARRYFFSGRR